MRVTTASITALRGAPVITRRACLVGAAAASAMACAPRAGAVAAAPGGPAFAPIAPYDDATYARRIDRVRSLARDAGCDVAFVTSGTTSFAYLAGKPVERSERLVALFVPVDGAPLMVAPSFEVERMRRTTRITEIRGWEEHGSPYAVARAALARVAPRARAILVEPHVEYATALEVARAFDGAVTLVDGAAAFAKLRVVKEPADVARLRRAIAITERAFEEAFASLRAGDRDRDVSARIHDAMVRLGADDGYALVQFGALAALPHGAPDGARLAPGQAVLIDGGAKVDGWWSDVTRTRWFGAPPDEARRVHALVHDAQSAALARVRPGVAAQEIDRAARDVIARAGYGAQFTHRTGHGLGMDGHEPIYLVEGNAEPLVEGCVFTIEPGIYLAGRFGVRIEDDVACGADGPVLLSERCAREPVALPS